MSRIRLAVLGVAVALLTGSMSTYQRADVAESLEGSWEVSLVQRDGEPDSLQVGAQMTFTGNKVTFRPKAVQFVDGTS